MRRLFRATSIRHLPIERTTELQDLDSMDPSPGKVQTHLEGEGKVQ